MCRWSRKREEVQSAYCAICRVRLPIGPGKSTQACEVHKSTVMDRWNALHSRVFDLLERDRIFYPSVRIALTFAEVQAELPFQP